jgi:hypothetical protein
VLSIAQPVTVTVPDNTAPEAGMSMFTLGGALGKLTVTDAEPVTGVALLSVANTVIV